MTVYEINYRNRLNEMVIIITNTYGENHRVTQWFVFLVNRHINAANYGNREKLENYFKNYMKNIDKFINL